MSESYTGYLERELDHDFDVMSGIMDETDGESLHDFFTAEVMSDSATASTCTRLSKYLESSSDADTGFALLSGINFAVTLGGLTGLKGTRTVETIGDILSDYEREEFTTAQAAIHVAVDNFFANNPTLDGFTQAYLLTDIKDSYDDIENPRWDDTMIASRFAAGMAFMALEEQAIVDALEVADLRVTNL